MRILLVDDEVPFAQAVRRGLEAEGVVVDVCHNGVEGLWLATESAYDVVVLDIMLPGRNGYQVLEALRAGELMLDPSSHRVTCRGEAVELTAKQFALLHFLVRNRDQVVSKAQILDNVWGSDFEGSENIVEVYVRNLRKRIDIPFNRESLEMVRGAGYRLTCV
ncbi:Response regulator receiver domain-containing protein [Actinomyces denticolens]|uniref:Response regulator receiver domain-containing protein n=1 Tax=Actinomyces denticolens TaxID=52767 RepID=A0ABY1IES2_9ACTO|nr:response regulator transcription factor [Actinomyces denticolens]SHJ07040.1 Response regulator receiver domain-containing protein [Actinomyces denticolens]